MKNYDRVKALLFLFISLSLILIIRLFYIQIIKGSFYTESAFLQKIGYGELEIRGGIFDRNGKSLTGNYVSSFAIISPKWLTLEEKKIFVENNILGSINDNDIKNIPVTTQNSKILYKFKNKTPGVFIYNKNIRYGPTALATHVVGYKGQTGIEKAYNSLLEGHLPQPLLLKDAFGQPIPGLSLDDNKSVNWGVKLTIDSHIQEIVENIMDSNLKKGAVVVMNAKTGEILAMASRPNFKQFTLKDYLDEKDAPLINRAVESYTPGSIFKIIVMSAALEENISELKEKFICSGYEKIGGNVFRCSSFDTGGHGEITLKDALAFSCNSVFIQIGTRLGVEKILDYAKKFGLGQKTSVGLPEEKTGNIPSAKEVYYQDLGNISIGQGPIGITPIQAAQIISVILNDGKIVRPKLIKELIDEKGNKIVMNFPQSDTQRIISPQTAAQVKEALEAVTKSGTGMRANPENGLGIGGKTGTAEVENGTSHAWFIGYYPAKMPELIVSVFVEHGGSGSSKAAPIFKQIIDNIN